MNYDVRSGRERVVRILLWVLAFLIPAVAIGRPLPHGPYGVVPALAVTDGIRIRRVLVWTVFLLAYEYWYGLPPGTLSVSVAVLAAVHGGIARFIRWDSGSRMAPSVSVPVRILLGLLWSSGMIVISALWLGLPEGSWNIGHLWPLWRTNGIFVLVMCAVSVIMLQVSRSGRTHSEQEGFL